MIRNSSTSASICPRFHLISWLWLFFLLLNCNWSHFCSWTCSNKGKFQILTIYIVCIVWDWDGWVRISGTAHKGLISIFTFRCFWNLLSKRFKAEENIGVNPPFTSQHLLVTFWVLLCENLKYDNSYLCSYVSKTRFTFTGSFFPSCKQSYGFNDFSYF